MPNCKSNNSKGQPHTCTFLLVNHTVNVGQSCNSHLIDTHNYNPSYGTRLPLYSGAYIEKTGEPGDDVSSLVTKNHK